MDLDLRKVRYFEAVARHAHFGRAADELFIAQPVLSRQVRALERELGVELLERTTRSVRLTAAGEQLAGDAPGILGAAGAVERRVHRAGRGPDRLVVGFAPGLSVAAAVTEYTRLHPDVEVRVESLLWYRQADAVRDGCVDVGYLRGAVDDADVSATVVGSERRAACLPVEHPLAEAQELTMSDLEGVRLLDTEARRAITVEEKFELVAAGEGVVLVPESVARYYVRPGLTYRRVVDSSTRTLAVAMARARRERHVLDFAEIAVRTLGAESTATLVAAATVAPVAP